MQRPRHAELRDLSDEPLVKSAVWLGVSSGHLSNCERGLAKLTPEQDAALCSLYLQKIKERMDRLATTIAADVEVSSNQENGNS